MGTWGGEIETQGLFLAPPAPVLPIVWGFGACSPPGGLTVPVPLPAASAGHGPAGAGAHLHDRHPRDEEQPNVEGQSTFDGPCSPES